MPENQSWCWNDKLVVRKDLTGRKNLQGWGKNQCKGPGVGGSSVGSRGASDGQGVCICSHRRKRREHPG